MQLIDFRDGKAAVTFGIHLGADNTFATHVEYVDVADQARRVDHIVPLAKLALRRKMEDILELLVHSEWNQISGSFEYKPPTR